MWKDLFVKKKKYAPLPSEQARHEVPEGVMTKCPQCKKIMYTKELIKNLRVCLSCGYHHPMPARERIASLLDDGSFREYDADMISVNPLGFPGYIEKLEEDRRKSGLNEAVVTGEGALDGHPLVIAVMDSSFRMGSMGSVVGEKITRAVERAREQQMPFLIFTASGAPACRKGC